MPSSYSGLGYRDRQYARELAKQAAYVCLRAAPAIHYTQGVRRWEGFDKNLRILSGEFPRYADCSSLATWWLWQPYGHFHLPDNINGEDWKGGYTGTLLEHGRSVLGKPWAVGDLVLYGPGTGHHVAMLVDRVHRLVISHGSENGPYLLHFDYRSDVRDVRRYI